MDNSNWRPSLPNGDPAMDTGDWRSQLSPDSRQKIVNKIMDTLKKHLPLSGTEGVNDLRRIAARFEEKIFSGAVNQADYLRKISMKMLTMETKSQNATGASSSVPAPNNVSSLDSIPNNQGHFLPGTLPNNQSQAPQTLLSQTMQSNTTASGMTGPTALPSSMPPTNNNVTSVVNQNSSMQNVAGMMQDSSGQHGLSSNMYSGSQRQMLSRTHAMSSQQQQQQPQSAQFLYQQQLQQQLLKQNFQSGNVQHMQQQQQQQQNLLQPNQMHSSQQPGISTSPSAVSSAPLQGPQSSPQQSMLRQHQSSLLRQHQQSQQASSIHNQQQTSLPQQPISPLQQQQQAQMMRQQAASGSGIQQKQMMGQNVVGDMQQQHQQRLLNQQNNLLNMQQQQKQQVPPQQQLMSQQNSLQQPLGNVAGLQQPQQQLLSSQVGNSSLQTNQQSVQHMLSQQRAHQAGHGVFSSQGQQSQNQMIPLQSHQQQLGLQQQQQPNLLQQDVQQRLQSSSLLPPQNAVDQQRQQLYQSQRTLPEMPSSSLDSTAQTESANGVDWQEEVFQKIQTMKVAYLPELSEINQRVAAKLQQDSLPQQQRSEQFEKLRQFKTMLERMMQFLSVPKINILPALKDKVANYETQIINFLTNHRPRRPVQQGQMQQQSAQNGQEQSHDSQATSQMQTMNMPGSGPRAQQSTLANMPNNVLSSRPVVSAQQNIPSSIPPSSLESGQGNALNNGQQVAMGSMQQNTSQQVNNSSASAQSGLSTLQSNFNQAQLSSSFLQQQQLRQQQFQQRQMQQQQLLQKQQLSQQQQQQLQARQQGAQSDMNDLSARQGMNVSRGMFQQHSLQAQRANYPLQQLKPGSMLPVTSPQMTQQHLSPQVDQKIVMSSVNKMGTPLQPANSPFVVPSPSTPLAPSPMQVESEKPSGVNTARQQATGIMQKVVQSIAIGTPGLSASPLLQDLTSPDRNNLNPNAAEMPIERLIRVVKSISPESLSSGVSDIKSVVSMVDRIAGSAPGTSSKAMVGEDLVAMTKCRLQARNFMMQEGMMANKKMKRHTTAMPLSFSSLGGSVGDNYKQFACSETSDLESTATSNGKKARTETDHALFEEIKEINQRLIDTVVEISDDEDADDPCEGAQGTTVRLLFKAVSLSPALKAHLSSTQMSPIQPLRLLVPCSYPKVSPSLLDKLPVQTSKENEDLSSKAMARFNLLIRSLSQPMSLKDIAKTWDACARTVICEYAQQYGGGTFSSKYGTWEKFVSAS